MALLLCEIWRREIRKWGQSSIVSEEGGWRSLSLHWKYVHGGWRALSFHWNSKITSRQWNEKKGNLKKRRLGAALSFHLITNLAEVFCEERKTRKEDPQRFTKSSMDMPVHWECKIWLLWSWCLCLFIWKCKIRLRRKRRGEFSESQIGNYRSRQSEYFFALEIKKGRLCIWERDQQSVHNQFNNLWCVSQSMTALCIICNCTTVQLYTMHNMQLCNCANLFLNSNREGKDRWNKSFGEITLGNWLNQQWRREDQRNTRIGEINGHGNLDVPAGHWRYAVYVQSYNFTMVCLQQIQIQIQSQIHIQRQK